MSLNERIRKRRHELGMTQLQLANKLNMGRSNVGHIENGRTQPPSEVLSQIAEALNTSADYLLGRTDEHEKKHYPIGSMGWMLSLNEHEYLEHFKSTVSKPFAAALAHITTLDEVVGTINDAFASNGLNFFFEDYKTKDLDEIKIYLESVKVILDKSLMPSERLDSKLKPDTIPLVGTICAGDELLAEQNIEGYIHYPFSDRRQPDFALRVEDNSMKDLGIEDGDIVFMRKAKWADFNGQIVAVIFNGKQGSLKRMKWYEGSPKIRLIPENEHFPIEVWPNEIQVCGVYMGFFRPVDNRSTELGFEL